MAVGVAWNGGDRGDDLVHRLDEAQRLATACGDVPTIARGLSLQADIASQRDGDFARATALLDQALDTWQSLDDGLNVLRMRYCIACVSFAAGRFQLACTQIDPVIEEARRLHAWGRLAQSLNVRGSSLKRLHAWADAKADLGESLRVAWCELALWNVAYALWNLPHALARTRQPEDAQRLAGFVSAFWVQGFGPLKPSMARELRLVRRLAQVQLSPQDAAGAFESGRRLALAQAVALALSAVST
jgi:tetratricopeptide (TPR) repeat protein